MRRNRVIINLAVVALFSALYFVFSRFLSISISMQFKISFVGVIVIYASIAFPLYTSLSIGIVGEFLCQLFSEYGLSPTTILWMLPPLFRIIPIWLGYNLFRKKDIDLIESKKIVNYIFYFLICIFANLLLTGVNSLVLYLDGLIMNYPSGLTLSIILIRFLVSIANGTISSLLVIPLYLATKSQVIKIYSTEKNN